MNDVLSKKISFVQMVFCIMIVFGHALDFSLIEQFRYQSIIGNVVFYILYIFNILCGAAVPSYFVMSGYLLFYKNGGVFAKIKSRFKSIFIPYVLWSLIGCFIWMAFNNNYSINIGSTIINSTYNASLWYMRNLIVYVVATPLIIPCIKRKKLCLILIAVLITFNIIFHNQLSYYSYSYGMIYYTVGGYFALHAKESVLKQANKNNIISSIIASGIVFVLAVKTPILTVNVGRSIVNLTWCVSIFVICDPWIRAKAKKRFPSLFYIYCGHAPMFVLINEIILKHIGMSHIGYLMIEKFLLMPIMAIGTLYFIQVNLKKYNLKIYKLLGGR